MKNSILSKETLIEKDINDLIEQGLEESINIEYKSAKALCKKDSYKREIAKDVRAFANSDGGIIFYGVIEENHKPSKVDFVDGNIFTKEWLENIIDSNIQQKIDGIRIYSIRFDEDIRKCVFRSDSATLFGQTVISVNYNSLIKL